VTAVDVTVIDRLSTEDQKRKVADRLTDVLVSLRLDRDPPEQTHWIVLAQAEQRSSAPEYVPRRAVAALDYPAWHAHLSGVRRWGSSATARRGCACRVESSPAPDLPVS